MSNLQNSNEKTLSSIDIFSLIVLVTIVVSFVVLLFYQIVDIPKKENALSVVVNMKVDSLSQNKKSTHATDLISIKNFSLLVDTLNFKIKELKNLEQNMYTSQKKSDEFFRVLLTFIGCVIAILGFFGYKSIHEARQTALSAVKDLASDTAKETVSNSINSLVSAEFESYLNTQGKEMIQNKSTQLINEIVYKEANLVASSVALEQSRIAHSGIEDKHRSVMEQIRFLESENRVLRKQILQVEELFYKIKSAEDSGEQGNGNPVPNLRGGLNPDGGTEV